MELKEGNPVRIRSIYERRITDHCLIPLVWHEYSQYLEEKLKDFESSLELLIRAVRNCNWSGALWVRILKCCERLGQSKSEICKHLEAGLVAGLGTIHILRKHFHSPKFDLISQIFTKTGFFRHIKRISSSTLHFDEFFM